VTADVASLRVALVFDDTLDRHGGVPQHVITLGRELSARGAHVSYLVGASSIDQLGDGVVHSLARNVPVRFNGSSGTIPALCRRSRLRKVVAEGVFDVVHVQVPFSPLMAGRVIAELPGQTALIGTFHINSELLPSRIGSRLLAAWSRQSLERFDGMMAVSAVAQQFAARYFALARSIVVPNMVDVSAFSHLAACAPPAPGDPRLAFVGNLVPRKGVLTLIEAFDMLRATYPQSYLTIAGDGRMRPRLIREIAWRGLQERVNLAETVSEAEKAQLLGQADVACFPSLHGESFGIVLLEAAASGCVVVAAANAAYKEVLAATPRATHRPGDAADLARVLDRLLSDPVFRERTRRAQRPIARHHDVARVTDQVTEIYWRALCARRPEFNARDAVRIAA
jgi:phosphatidyl-myo-inositol alpha-mannosyltransferase